MINAADSTNASAVKALLSALEGSGKLFLHTSGSGTVGDKAAGSFFYVENGEVTMKAIAEAISRLLGLQGSIEIWSLSVSNASLCHVPPSRKYPFPQKLCRTYLLCGYEVSSLT